MIIERTLTLDDQIAGRYLELPFEVPAGAASLEVRLSYDADVAVIDLGCEGAAAWRGWSGGARRRFAITADAATMGYLPGAPEAGTWKVILGLHKIPADGVAIRVEVDLPATGSVEVEPVAAVDPDPPAPGSVRAVPAPDGLTWFAGDFHGHTLHSDGTLSIDELAALGRSRGLDFMAITDHNTTSHHALLPAIGARHGITLVPGQEVTTHRGHANAFGDIGFIDFRRHAQEWVDETAARGGILSVNHAVDGDCAWQHPLERIPGALELWHISWFRDLAASFPWTLWRLWTRDRASTPSIIGGADYHAPSDGWFPGTPTTWVAARENTPAAILEGVRAGRTSVSVGVAADGSANPLGAPLLVRIGSRLLALAADGAVLVDLDGVRRRVQGEAAWFEADGVGPYHLQDADRRVLAISA